MFKNYHIKTECQQQKPWHFKVKVLVEPYLYVGKGHVCVRPKTELRNIFLNKLVQMVVI
jgi:hypothetical protein